MSFMHVMFQCASIQDISFLEHRPTISLMLREKDACREGQGGIEVCRLLYIETEQPYKFSLKIAKFALNWWSHANDDGTGLALDVKGSIKIVKTKDLPKPMFKRNHIPRSRRIAGHVRASTMGSVCDANSHPFISCDGRSAFMHNGILQNWQALKTKLVKGGHKFTSETDSEVMLHLAEEVGPTSLMQKLKDEGVTGYANWVWMTPEKTFAYSDGALVLVRNDMNMQVAVFSDVEWAEKKFFKKPKNVPAGTLITIENGKFTSKNDGPSIRAPLSQYLTNPGMPIAGYVGGPYDASLNAAWERTQAALLVQYQCSHGVSYLKCNLNHSTAKPTKPEREQSWVESMTDVEWEKYLDSQDDECLTESAPPKTEESAWIGPGDLFCKRCNVVYSEETASGRCSICYGDLLNVSAL